MAATTSTSNKDPHEKESEQVESQAQITSTPPYNIFRDSALRYAGYANEVGESFRYQIPRLVVPTYVVAFTYVCADAISTGHETWQKQAKAGLGGDNGSIYNARWHDTIYATADTLLWQSLASVVVPGATINMIVKGSRYAVRRSPLALPVMVAQWLPTAVGLGSIALIVQPIDHAIDYVLDHSTRHWWKESKSNASKED
jgi:fission process protein 1